MLRIVLTRLFVLFVASVLVMVDPLQAMSSTRESSHSAQVVPRPSVLAGMEGLATKMVLDTLEDRAKTLIGAAAGNASLVASKAARDVLLLIEAARQGLADVLDRQWERLDVQKVDLLRSVDEALGRAEEMLKEVGRLEDQVALDIDTFLGRFPFLGSTPTIRRIDGSSQYFRTSGIYRIVIKGTALADLSQLIHVKIAGEKVPPERLIRRPPHELEVRLPSGTLNKLFQRDQLTMVPFQIAIRVPAQLAFYDFTSSRWRDAIFNQYLELFPQRIASYRLIEYTKTPVVDRSTRRVQKGPVSSVPGCGNSGCNAYHNVCTDVPAGAEVIGWTNQYDSFSGWGGFQNPRKTSTGMCATFWQHSHNQTRNVSFDVEYHPAAEGSTKRPRHLEALTSNPSSVIVDDQLTEKECNTGLSVRSISTVVANMLSMFSASASGTMASMSCTERAAGGFIRPGWTYSARFGPEMQSFDLIVRAFTGEEYVLTPGSTADGPLKRSVMENAPNFKRFTVTFQLPW